MKNADSVTRDRLIRMRDVIERTALSRSEIYRRRIIDPLFPKPVPLGSRSVAFIESEIDSYLKKLIAKRDSGRPA